MAEPTAKNHTMTPIVYCADPPPSLRRLLDPLTALLGVPAAVQASVDSPVWPDPGREAHVILHREFAERGACPLLGEQALIPLDGGPPTTTCPLGLTVRRFAIPLADDRTGVLVLGPYFLCEEDREGLRGRSLAADAALAQLPCMPADRHALLKTFYREFAAFAGSAAKAGAAKETFLANMSHELRTPLNGIMVMLSLLLQGEVEPRQRQFLQLAMDASNQLLGVVNDLLEMTNISMGRLELAAEPFDLRRGLADLFAACAEDAGRRGLSFSVVTDADVPEILVGDVARLRQILLNLIGNAVKFTVAGSVTIRISRRGATDDHARATLLFSVRDTGIGIPVDKQRLIFERFAIAEDFLSKRYGAAGLGLSISKEIVEKMGGDMCLESTPGRGSAFSFTAVFGLPDEQHARLACQPETSLLHCQGAVVAYAEDEPVSQLLVRRILEDRGYVALLAASGEELLDILRERAVDLVLMDIQMRGANGLETTARIRAGDVGRVPADIPIIGLSAYAGVEDRRRGLAAGMTDYITKPVTRPLLLAAVERALSGGGGRDCLKSPAA